MKLMARKYHWNETYKLSACQMVVVKIFILYDIGATLTSAMKRKMVILYWATQ